MQQEMVLTPPSEKVFFAALMDSIRQSAVVAEINAAQCKVLATRCQVIFNTMVLMKAPEPTPNLLSVFRSGEYLLRRMHTGDVKEFAERYFTAEALFEAFYDRLTRVWSLHPTSSWEDEDVEARKKDELEIAALVQRWGMVPEDLTPNEIVSRFRRKMMSGWKIPFTSLTCEVPDSEILSAPQAVNSAEAAQNSSHFRTVAFGMLNKNPVVVSEFEGTVTPQTLQAFVTDAVSRRTWFHPNLVEFYGAYTEKFDDKGVPSLVLGVFEENLSTSYQSFHELLFRRGIRLPLRTIIHIVLQAADALQYALLNPSDVSPAVVESWSRVTPSDLFVQSVSESADLENQNPHEGDFSLLPPMALARAGSSSPKKEASCESPNDLSIDERHYTVKFSPRWFVEGEPISRWDPHPLAANPVCYVLTELLIAGFTGLHPLRQFQTPDELNEVRQTAGLSRDQLEGLPDNYVVPSYIPVAMQKLCRRGFAHLSKPPVQSRLDWIRGRTPPPPVQKIASLQEFRKLWKDAVASELVKGLPEPIQTTPPAPFEPDMGDYGSSP